MSTTLISGGSSSGGGGGAITAPLGPHVAADSVSVTLATDESPIDVTLSEPDTFASANLTLVNDTLAVVVPEGYNSVFLNLFASGTANQTFNLQFTNGLLSATTPGTVYALNLKTNRWVNSFSVTAGLQELFYVPAISNFTLTVTCTAAVAGFTQVDAIVSKASPFESALTNGDLRASAVAVSVADGSDANAGTTADGALTADGSGTLSAKLRGLVKWAYERMPASLGSKTSANSLPVVIASDQAAVAVSGTVTANQGTPAVVANAWPTKISDGTNTAAVENAAGLTGSDGFFGTHKAVLATLREAQRSASSNSGGTYLGIPVFGTDQSSTFRPFPLTTTPWTLNAAGDARLQVVDLGAANFTGNVVLNGLGLSSLTDSRAGNTGSLLIAIRNTGSFIGTLKPVGYGFNVSSLQELIAVDVLTGRWVTELEVNKQYYIPAGAMSAIGVKVTAYTSGSCTIDLSPVTTADAVFALADNPKLEITPGTASTSVVGPMVQGLVTAASSSYSDSTVRPISLTTEGLLRVEATTIDRGASWPQINDNPWDTENPFVSTSPW